MSEKDDPAILIVGSQRAILSPILSVYRECGVAADGVKSGREALSALTERPVPIVICSWRLRDMSGSRLMEDVKARWPQTKVVALFRAKDLVNGEIPSCPWAEGHLVEPFGAEEVLACTCRVAIRQMSAFDEAGS